MQAFMPVWALFAVPGTSSPWAAAPAALSFWKNHLNRTKGVRRMSTKKYFEVFLQSWPKGVFARRVGGERGNHDLPSGAKGGEKMNLARHDEHKQHAFDSFCKKVIRCEAYNAYRAIGRR